MKFILNQFNSFDGRYQIPIAITHKKKFGKNWYLFVKFPGGKAEFINIDYVEKNAITVIDTRKLKNLS